MTNNPARYGGLAGYGLEIAERLPLIVEPTPDSAAYLDAKRRRLGHLLPDQGGFDALAEAGSRRSQR